MNGCSRGIGIDLIKNIRKLHVKLILGHKANMRGGQNIRMRQKNMLTIQKRLVIEHIHSGVKLTLRSLSLQGTGGHKSRTGRIHE